MPDRLAAEGCVDTGKHSEAVWLAAGLGASWRPQLQYYDVDGVAAVLVEGRKRCAAWVGFHDQVRTLILFFLAFVRAWEFACSAACELGCVVSISGTSVLELVAEVVAQHQAKPAARDREAQTWVFKGDARSISRQSSVTMIRYIDLIGDDKSNCATSSKEER